MLTRRAFTGAVGTTICGLNNFAPTGASAQSASPGQTLFDVNTIDPSILRILRTRENRERLNLDIARGRVAAQSLSTKGDTDVVVSMRVLVELSEDNIPEALRQHKWIPIIGRVYAADLPLDAIERLAHTPGVVYIEGERKFRPTLDTSRQEIKADIVQIPPSGVSGLDGNGVIVGIIDHGLDFSLGDFRVPSQNALDPDETRIAFLWNQDRDPVLPGEVSPAPFGFGVEYDKKAIDDALKKAAQTNSDPLAELQYQVKRASHGTHVAGIAAGNGRSDPTGGYIGIAPASTIIFVDLGKVPDNLAVPNEKKWSNVLLGVKYIFEKAQKMKMPCVINISQGANRGSHDGQTVVERTIDELLLQQSGRAVVKSAGNLHDNRSHAAGTLTNTRPRRELTWRVRWRDPTANKMEIWHTSQDSFRVRLTSPAGSSTPWVSPKGKFESPPASDPSIFIHNKPDTSFNHDTRIYIEIEPAVRFPRGNWIVEIEALGAIHNGKFDAWIEQDDDQPSNQSQFLGSDFDGQVTLSIPGTGLRTITVANYDHLFSPPEINPSSSRGPTRDGRMKPEIAAPGTDILSSRSRGDPNTPGDMYARMSGTSMAAPHVAGAVALILQRHPRLTAEEIRAALIASADPVPGSSGFSNDFGFGRLNIARCLERLGP